MAVVGAANLARTDAGVSPRVCMAGIYTSLVTPDRIREVDEASQKRSSDGKGEEKANGRADSSEGDAPEREHPRVPDEHV